MTLLEQQQLPYPEKLNLARRVIRRTWRNRQDLPEDERIEFAESACLKLMSGDAAAASRLFQEAILP